MQKQPATRKDSKGVGEGKVHINTRRFIFAKVVKALLSYAIFSATCLAMVGNLALQVAEVWC